MSAPPDTYEYPAHGWTCFHCGETFTTVGGARDHFGADPSKDPGCMVRVQLGEERGLLMALRKVEDELERVRTDLHNDSSASRVFHEMLVSAIQSYPPFRKCHSMQDVFNVYDSMEGRALAAESYRTIPTREVPCYDSES